MPRESGRGRAAVRLDLGVDNKYGTNEERNASEGAEDERSSVQVHENHRAEGELHANMSTSM